MSVLAFVFCNCCLRHQYWTVYKVFWTNLATNGGFTGRLIKNHKNLAFLNFSQRRFPAFLCIPSRMKKVNSISDGNDGSEWEIGFIHQLNWFALILDWDQFGFFLKTTPLNSTVHSLGSSWLFDTPSNALLRLGWSRQLFLNFWSLTCIPLQVPVRMELCFYLPESLFDCHQLDFVIQGNVLDPHEDSSNIFPQVTRGW